MTTATQSTRKRWFERMTPDERARWFKHTSPERFAVWFDEQVRRGVFPAKCEDPVLLAETAAMVVAARRPPNDLAEAA
jgi:hypothetical protein